MLVKITTKLKISTFIQRQ